MVPFSSTFSKNSTSKSPQTATKKEHEKSPIITSDQQKILNTTLEEIDDERQDLEKSGGVPEDIPETVTPTSIQTFIPIKQIANIDKNDSSDSEPQNTQKSGIFPATPPGLDGLEDATL